MELPVVLVADERTDRRDALVDELHEAGFATTTALGSKPVAAIVAAIEPGDEMNCLPACARTGPAQSVPVIAVVDEAAPELCLRAAIEGAVQCVTRADGSPSLAGVLIGVLAADAPSLVEQQRRARVGALEALARSGRPAQPSRVRLTRLERRPVGDSPRAPAERTSRLAGCTPKQRELLELISRSGSVSNAANALGTSRSNMYAALRRIAHRIGLRDSGELLRLIGAEEPVGHQ